MIIEISVAVIAVCMVVFMIVAIIIGVNLQKSLKNIDHAITSVELKLDDALDEVSITLSEATAAISTLNEVVVSVKNKVASTDPLFGSIDKIGQIIETLLSHIPTPEPKKPKIFSFSNNHKGKFEVADVAEWVGLGVLIWQKLKQRI